MLKSEEIIETYLNDKSLSNREIAKIVRTSRRHVRRILNPIRDNKKDIKIPKIGIIDIETSPMLCLTWHLGKQRISPDNVVKEWAILSYSFKSLFDDTIISETVTPKEAINRKDKSIIKGLWNIFNDNDILIGHNLQKFDVRKSNARFILNGLGPPMPYRIIDTLKVAKQMFAMSSYKLDYLNKLLELPRKIKTDFQLWIDCINGDSKALNQMRIYNEYDIKVTEELYMKIRPWIRNINLGLYFELNEEKCPTCGGTNLIWKGKYYTPAGRFKSGRCDNCKSIFRSRYSDLTKEERRSLLVNTAR
jgi:hypothetical protein